jgi:hypothetical protein
LSLEVEFGKIVLEGSMNTTYSWTKTKLTCIHSPKCCWFSIASCNTCKNYKRCIGQSLRNINLKKNMLATNYNYVKRFIISKWRKAPQCKLILTSFGWL